MSPTAMSRFALKLVIMVLITASASVAKAPELPNPVAVFVGVKIIESGGKQFTRYTYEIHNKEAYPAELFAPAPALPPCGQNKNAARTWVDLYEQNGKRLNGFCAINKLADLNNLWFELESGVTPPSWIYLELTDRQTGTKYKSNLAETTL
jgi:hypothetical protein